MSVNVVKDISVDFYTKKRIVVDAKQGDSGSRFVRISCLNQGSPVVIDNNESMAIIRVKKSDGHYVYNSCDITEDGKVMVELTGQMLAAAGSCYADVVIAGKLTEPVSEITAEVFDEIVQSGSISTMCFSIDVTPAAVSDDEIESSDESSFIDRIVQELSNKLDKYTPSGDSGMMLVSDGNGGVEESTDSLDNKLDKYTASGNYPMILTTDGNGGVEESGLEVSRSGYAATTDDVDDALQDAKDYADTLFSGVDMDSGAFNPKVYAGNGTEVTSGLNRYGFYTKVGNVCFFRLELEVSVSADVGVREVEMPVARSSSATRQHAIMVEPTVSGYLYSPGAQTPPTPISVGIMNGNHGFAFFLASDQTIHYAQGQILSIEGWYVCG